MLPDLDPVLHAPVRLGLVSVLSAMRDGREATFGELQQLLSLSPGNLSTHLRKLEEAGLVSVTKAFRDRIPTTSVSLTPRGRDTFASYGRAVISYLDGSAAQHLLDMEESP